MIKSLLLLLLFGEGYAGNFYFSPWEGGYRKDRLLDDQMDMDSVGSVDLTANLSMRSIDYLQKSKILGTGPPGYSKSRRRCKPSWASYDFMSLSVSDPNILKMVRQELVRPDGACGEGNPAPRTNITAGCDAKSINKCCSAANLCGTECSCEGCINYDSVQAKRTSSQSLTYITSREECARRCLQSPACDMFFSNAYTCAFYPNIKLKGKLMRQVTSESYGSPRMGLYVLECDDSQANVLDNNDWDTNSPPATWTESLTCGATGDTSIYQGTRRNTHFKGMLPACPPGWMDFINECVIDSATPSPWNRYDTCRSIRHSTGLTLENQAKYDLIKTKLNSPGSGCVPGVADYFTAVPAGGCTKFAIYKWTAGTDISNENNFQWLSGNGQEIPSFSFAKWLPGAPNNAGGSGAPDDPKRPGEHCVAYETQSNLLNDIPCSYSASHLCQSGKELTGLGGSVDGYAIEHAGTCSGAFSYSIQKTMTEDETGLSPKYIQLFKPIAFMKVWARFASPVVTTASGTITASVTDAESTIISRKIEIQKSFKTESFPAIVPLTPLPVFPLTIKVNADTTGGGTILFSPLELIVDQPINIGCFQMKSGDNEIETESIQDCLINCKSNQKRFALITSGNKCSCISDIDQDNFVEIEPGRCDIECSDISQLFCGGIDTVSLYTAECEQGFWRFGNRCYKDEGSGHMTKAGKCYTSGSDIWAPRFVGEAEVISSLFSSGNKVYHLGTTYLDRGLLSHIDNSQFLSYFPLFSPSTEWDGLNAPVEPFKDMYTAWVSTSDQVFSSIYMSNNSTVKYIKNGVGQIVCEKPIVEGYGNKKLLGSKYVDYKFFDAGVEILSVNHSILPGQPGISFRFELLRGSFAGKWFEIRFNETIVLNSLLLTMDKNNFIKNFGLRIPMMNPQDPDYQYYEFFTHQVFPTNTSDLDDPIKKSVRLNHPVVVDRIQFQLSSLTQSVLMRLELFGLLLRDILPNKYFQLGQPTLIKESVPANKNIKLKNNICPEGGIHISGTTKTPVVAETNGLSMTVKGVDSAVLLSIKLILSPAEAKLDIDTTATTINPPINYGEITDVYISCNNDKFQVFVNNYPQGEFDASHSSGFPSPASVDISYESAVFDNLFFEQLGNDKSIFTPPDMNNRIGCNGTVCTKVLHHRGKVLQVYKHPSLAQITYLTGEPTWRCHRTPTFNVKCNNVGFSWYRVKMFERTLPTTSVCPAGNDNIALAAQCVRTEQSEMTYAAAVEACGAKQGLITSPIDDIQTAILGIYAKEKGLGSFWVGVKKSDGVWMKTNGDVLSPYEVEITNKDASDECLVADKDTDYKHKIVDCNLKFSHYCTVSPNCPQNYTWVPELGRTCLRIGEFPGSAFNKVDYFSGEKYCARSGTRLFTPNTATELEVLKSWLPSRRMEYNYNFDALLGWKGFLKDNNQYFRSPFSMKAINLTEMLAITRDIGTINKECFRVGPAAKDINATAQLNECFNFAIRRIWGPPTIFDPDLRTLCQFTECLTVNNKVCKFPFRYKGRLHDTCITIDSNVPWCSLSKDSKGNHIETETSRGQCQSSCAIQNCPVGFFFHETTCIHLSARTESDIAIDVDHAVQQCTTMGARLFQPRDFTTYDNLLDLENEYLKSSSSLFYHSSGKQSFSAIGAFTSRVFPGLEIQYMDGSRAYMIEKKIADQGSLKSSTLTGISTYWGKACIMIDKSGFLTLENCTLDSEINNLAYICEAKTILTVDGPVTNTSCHFPFKRTGEDIWRTSCVLDEELGTTWCATEVYENGTMKPEKWGTCRDEREIAYRGTGSGNGCITPFLYERIWYEKCILAQRDELWCPTKLNPTRMFNESIDEFSYCTEFMRSGGSECSANYEKINGSCIRVSSYQETFIDAVAMCAKEGAFLLSIMDDTLIPHIQLYIKYLLSSKTFFLPKYAPDLSSYWIGGVAKDLKWSWMSNQKNFSSYSNWKDGKENMGCLASMCTDNYALTVESRKFQWVAEDKGKKKPYICQSHCKLGYIWFPNIKKCLKVENMNKAMSFNAAIYACAKDHARLTQFDNCDEFISLGQDLWLLKKSPLENYWIGLFGGDLDDYRARRVSSSHRKNKMSISSNGYAPVSGCPWMTAVNFNSNPSKGFLRGLTSDINTVKMDFIPFTETGAPTLKGYICERENKWTCPDDYILFQEECYRFYNEPKSFTEALVDCNSNGSHLVEPTTILHTIFVSSVLQEEVNVSITIWTGFRKLLYKMSADTDKVFYTSDYSEATKKFIGMTGSGNCVGMESPSNVFQLNDCSTKLPYICQTIQIPNPDVIEVMGIPEYVHPLDNVTEKSKELNVGFADTSVWKTELKRHAVFMGSKNSYISQDFNTTNITSTIGMSIGLWIRLKSSSSDNIPIIDTGNRLSQNLPPFYIYLKSNSICFNVCQDMLCQQSFTGVSHDLIELNRWTFIGLTFDSKTETATLIINETFGSKDGEGLQINFSSNGWFKTNAIGKSFKIGATNAESKGFLGDMSCLQISSKVLNLAQMYQMSKICHVHQNYERSKPCPSGYKLYHHHCYKLSQQPMSYTDAEISCTSDPSSDYVTHLTYPVNYEILKVLGVLANKSVNTNIIWVGLDSESVHPPGVKWIDSSGNELTEIPWADNQPSSSEHCVAINATKYYKFVSASCEDKFYFYCSTEMNRNYICPEDHISYKGKCLYKSQDMHSLVEAKHACAIRGGIVLPVKTQGVYKFIQKYLIQQNSGDLIIGLNMTAGVDLFTDNSPYTAASYDYEGDGSKLVGSSCAFLKRGIKFKPRGTSCDEKFEYVCQWTPPPCPTGFERYSHEKDGRTCFARSSGTAPFSDKQCTSLSNDLQRRALPKDIKTIEKILQYDSPVWLDGSTTDGFNWYTKNDRTNDFDSPEDIVDYSKERSWISALAASGYYVKNPTSNTIKMKFKQDICQSSGSEMFLLNGTFVLKRLDTNKPTIKLTSSSVLIPLRWMFHKGGVDSTDANLANSFTLARVEDGIVNNNTEVELVGHKVESTMNFFITIACQNSKFYVSFNNYTSVSIPFKPSESNDIIEVSISGSVLVSEAGYGGQGCLSLAENGRIMTKYGDDCKKSLPSICEYQACFTKDGFSCIFPFTYKTVEYKRCSSQDLYEPWCPTELDADGNITAWGFCVEDCPFEPPAPSCLDPPPVPSFGAFNTEEVNYNSNWFSIENLANQSYKISSNRERPHRPGLLYDPNNTTETVEIIMANSFEEFNAVYGIVQEGFIANYTCPLGFVFNNSFNIFFEATCSNWTWSYSFNETSRCVPVVCDVTVPRSPNNTEEAAHDAATRNSSDPNWNIFMKKIQYSCPDGHVLENPSLNNEQITNINKFDVLCDADRHWRPMLSYNLFPNPPIMPACIAINCTAPFILPSNWPAKMNWNETVGKPRPYNTIIVYECTMKGWGYFENGFNQTVSACLEDGNWNVTTVFPCIKLPCPDQPPPVPEGPGALRLYNPENTRYKCKNGYMFQNGDFPFLENECLPNKRWTMPTTLVPCIKRRCLDMPPAPPYKFDRIWPNRINELGDIIIYRCPHGQRLDIPLPSGHIDLDTLSWGEYGNVPHPQRDQAVECVWRHDIDQGFNDSMIWWPRTIQPCTGTIPPPDDVVVLPTLPPYAVDYPATTSYYWPHISENITQISSGGLNTFDEEPSKGPFGFGPSLKLNQDKCVVDGTFAKNSDLCIRNPKNCLQGISFSIWEKTIYDRDIIDKLPDDSAFTKKYIVGTGADYDATTGKTIPGFALYHIGMDVVAVVSTGDDVWELKVRGPVVNETWTNYGIIWTAPDLDTTKVVDPIERGGLILYFNLEQVGQSILPLARPAAGWTELPELSLPAMDPAGNPIPGGIEGPPVMIFGCQYNKLDLSQPEGFAFHQDAIFDEMAIWTRKLEKTKSIDETLYFMGGYVEDLETMTPEKFAEMLKAVDMTDPDQAAAAGSLTGKLLDNTPESPATAVLAAAGAGAGTPATQAPAPGGSGQAAAISVIGVQTLPWKERKKRKQLALVATYQELLKTDGVSDGALPKHLDKRFWNIKTAAKMMSCDPENIERWKIVQEDDDLPGSSDYVQQLENYALAFMSSANISFYDDTEYFNSTTREYVVHIPTNELYMSIQKMPMSRLQMKGSMYNVGAYTSPPGKWTAAVQNWENPKEIISMPTDMYASEPNCLNNPITFLYSVYPCYGMFAPLRRSPVSITAERFIIDSKVISVKIITNNDTFNPTIADSQLCQEIPVDLKYTPIMIKFYHTSRETARRKVLFHEDEIKTSIDTRRCVMWNPDIGVFGAWDADGCTTVMSQQDSTTCECSKFGTFALAAEKIVKPEGKHDYTWLLVSRYIGFGVSILSLLIFVIIICANKHLWEMFHLLRLNTGICYLFALFFHFLSELDLIREDRHINAAFSSLILFFYITGSYFQLMEAFAEFRAITAGIVGGKTAAYLPIGWGAGFLCLGFTWYMYGNDIGTDPNVFIGWENETKMPFLIMNYAALGTALLLSAVVILNASSPQTRKEDVVEDLQAQGQGLLITNFLFVMVWLFAFPAYVKFPGTEMTDFYPVFSIFNSWMGLIILVFLGLSSKRFRYVLSTCCSRKNNPSKAYIQTSGNSEDTCPIVPLEEDSPTESRPGSGISTGECELPGTVDTEEQDELDEINEEEEEDKEEDEEEEDQNEEEEEEEQEGEEKEEEEDEEEKEEEEEEEEEEEKEEEEKEEAEEEEEEE